jgi:hypothetical protein
VRVVLTDHVADDAGGFFVGLVPVVAKLVHRVKHAAVNRLETIPDIGKRTPHDDTHRVVQVGLAHFVFEVYMQNFFGELCHSGILLRNINYLIVLWIFFLIEHIMEHRRSSRARQA